MNFTFTTVPSIIFETGSVARLGELVKPLMRRPVLVTDQGVIGAGLTDDALAGLRRAGMDYLLFDQVAADPPAAVVRQAVETARAHGADGVIGLGGGSSMDTAKVIALLLESSQSLEDIYGLDQVTGNRAPLVLLPTTAGTGSEVTNIAVITTDDDQKMGVVANQLYADIAILDASLTLSAPRPVTAATGIDAMVHAIEAYTSKIKKNPLSDTLARRALQLLSSHIVRACEQPDDIHAREQMLLGAMLAGQAFDNAPVAAVHAMAYPLGARFHVAHGLSNSLMLAPVLRFNAGTAAALYAELAEVIGAGNSGGRHDRAASFVEKMTEICSATGVQDRLSQVGVEEHHLPQLAEDVMQITRLLQNNPRDLTQDDALRLYQQVL